MADTQAQIVGQVPAHAKQDHRLVELAAFEHRNPPKWLKDPLPLASNKNVATHPARLALAELDPHRPRLAGIRNRNAHALEL